MFVDRYNRPSESSLVEIAGCDVDTPEVSVVSAEALRLFFVAPRFLFRLFVAFS